MGRCQIRRDDDGKPILHKGLRFSSLRELKDFLQDYSVRHHRPYRVYHSDISKRYTVICDRGCAWRVWARATKDNDWRISRVIEPHTCGTSAPSGIHGQLTAKYLATRITGMVRADPDVSIATLIEFIFSLTSYRVKYGKAWRAKQRAMELLWGDWKEAYGMLPRILIGMQAANPGLECYPFRNN